MASHDHDSIALRPIQARAGESPDRAELPFWVDACLHLAPPKQRNGKPRSNPFAVLEAARALVANQVRARGDEEVQLDRAALARWARTGHSRNCGWIVRYLQQIGFLEVHSHPSATGQRPDTFDVFISPPANYIGPATYAELDMALRRLEDGIETPVFSQVNPTSPYGEGGVDPRSASGESAQVNPTSPYGEGGVDPRSASGESAQVNPTSPYGEGASSRGTSGTSVEEVPEVVGESATPPADAGADAAALHDEIDWARKLVRQLPWRDTGRVPRQVEAQELAARFRAATDRHGFTEEAVRDLAKTKLAQADPKKNPVRWVIGAFDEERLSRVCPAGEPEPLEPPDAEPAASVAPQPADQQPDEELPDPAPVRAQDAEVGPSPVPDWIPDAQYAAMTVAQRQYVNLHLAGTLTGNMRRSLNHALLDRGLEPIDEPDEHERALLRARRERGNTPASSA